jgi:SET domain-containing protein
VRPAEIRPSDIAGKGLFAAEPATAGSMVLEQAGVGALNHSCDPNLGWQDDHTLVALRDIAAGEELTIDYATVVADAEFVMMCHCETYRCRQVVEGGDWQIPQLQRRYAGRWAPAVQRKIDEASR